MLREWKKMIVLTAGLSLVGLTTAVKADHFGQDNAGATPRTYSNYQNGGYNRYNQDRRVRVYINLRGAERFGYQIQRQLEEIAGDRFKLVQRRDRADVVIGMNSRLSRIEFRQYDSRLVQGGRKNRGRNGYGRNARNSNARYEIVTENMFLSYEVNIRVRFNGQFINQRTFSGQVNQRRKIAKDLRGYRRTSWNTNAPNRRIATLLAAGSIEGTKMAKRQLRNSAAREIAFKIVNMRSLNRIAQKINNQRADQYNGGSNGKPINWKNRLIAGLISEIIFKSRK